MPRSSSVNALTVVWLMLAVVYLAYGLVRGSVPARAASGILLAVTTIYQYFEMFVKENGQDNALSSFF